MKIALCGLAASGKGTIARSLANELSIGYIDLGLMFRLGAFAIDVKRLTSLEVLHDLMQEGSVVYDWFNGKASIFWQDEDITSLLFTQCVAQRTSVLAADELQQEALMNIANGVLAGFDDVVCDGRNAGTSILPNPDYMFFVTAQLEERARRRHLDLIRLGENASYEEVLIQLRERDRRDTHRSHNPFFVPDGAILLETDTRSIEQSVRFIQEKIGRL